MPKIDATRFVLAPWFLVGFTLLVINDFVLKVAFGNFLTGKLSDFAGLFVFPFFISAILPARRDLVYVATGILFCAWKSPLSGLLIGFVNGFNVVSIGRTVDYTDLIALTVMPVSLFYFDSRAARPHAVTSHVTSAFAASVAIASVFAFGATTMAGERSVTMDRVYYVRERVADVRSVLEENESIRLERFEHQTLNLPTNSDGSNNPNTWIVEFHPRQKLCGSSLATFRFVVADDGSRSQIAPTFVHFQCPDEKMQPTVNAATERYEEEFRAIFEREVIQRLTLEGTE
jgi:hypothetical protein